MTKNQVLILLRDRVAERLGWQRREIRAARPEWAAPRIGSDLERAAHEARLRRFHRG